MNQKPTYRHSSATKRAAAVYAGLFVFGAGYNWLIGQAQEKGLPEGYESDLVVGGTAATILGLLPVLGIRKTVLVSGAFAAAGLPMIIGAKLRYIEKRGREDEQFRRRKAKENESASTG